MLLREFLKSIFLTSCLFATLAFSADAATDDPKLQLLFVGAAPEAAAPSGLPVIAIPDLPDVASARQEIFAARLRSSPVSTFVSEPGAGSGPFDQFFLVTDLALLAGEAGFRIGLGDSSYTLTDFTDRMAATIEAFNPKHRRIGFLRITDEGDEFPMAMSQIQTALNALGFDMLVLMIGPPRPGETCDLPAEQTLHFGIVSGLADRVPFGDGDGVSTAAEVEDYLTRALNRRTARDPGCGPKYSLILKSDNDAGHSLVTHTGKSDFTGMEAQLYHETFEAMFLMDSASKDNVQGFLASCIYCPNELALNDRLREMEDFARTSALEAEIWQRINNDPGPDRLAIYIENCAICAFRPEAEARIAKIRARAEALEAEEIAYRAAAEGRDLQALRVYADGCIACAHVDAARDLIAGIEADKSYQAEQDMLSAALASRDPAVMGAYLENCSICDGKDAVAGALVVAARRAEVSAPCLTLAAVPQLGGPRKLEAIDRDAALAACTSAAAEFPEDGLLRTTLGRIAQAAGDFETAKAAYDFGMADNVPSAFGLAAYSHYAPPEGARIDLDRAEELARTGAAMGDWLSREILTVLYSKDLIPGKTAQDAFDIARTIADEGNPLGQFFVGYYYMTGTGVDASEDQAAEWLARSVDQGYTHAFSFLAELFEQGRGTDPDPERAAELYWTALEQGDPTATERLTTQLGNRDREVVRIVQQKMRDLGAYRGSADGIAGPGTVAAIRKYADSLTEPG